MAKKEKTKFIEETRRTFKVANHSKGSGVEVNVQVKECKSVILHPSLTCPLMMTADEPIRIYMLSDDNFFNMYNEGPKTEDAAKWQSSTQLRRTIARCLKITTLDDALGLKKNKDTKSDKPIYKKDEAEKNIAVKYIGVAGKVDLKNQGKSEHFNAIVRGDAVRLYGEKKLTHIFQVEIHNHKKTGSKKGLLYEISWVTQDKKLKLHGEDLLERQDQYTNEFIKSKKYIKNHDDPEKTELVYAFKIKGKEFTFEQDKKQPIQNFHPICIRANKDPLNIGQLTDVHVSSRQHAFDKSNAELIHGSNTNVIGPLVNTCFNALKDLMDQYGEDPKIDILVFTGDLIDYNRNYHPKKFMDGSLTKSGELWQEMFLDNMNQRDAKGKPVKDKQKNIIPNTEFYPSSIDNVTMYSLFLYYYKTHKKPIFLISGNHECYSVPFGISPRTSKLRGISKKVFTWSKQPIEKQIEDSRKLRKNDMKKEKKGGTTGGMRANTGVPADHNLTFGEAALMYGPSYHQIAMFGDTDTKNTFNFKPKNIDWFYTVFTPLSDYTFTWGIQNFIALEWGDGERMLAYLDSQAKFSGILPRATHSLTDKQLLLSKKAITLNKPCTILLTHFTFVNYDQPQSIKTLGVIDIDNKGKSHGKFDYGTFEKNRELLYLMLATNKIHFAMAGHAHRSALYQHTNMSKKKSWIHHGPTGKGRTETYYRKQFEVKAITANHASFKYENLDEGAAKIIGTACGGPIAIQNFDKELGNWGLAYPSGSYIYFNASGKEDEIGIKVSGKDSIPAAKPRLAVALDFGDVLGREDRKIGGFIKRLESTQYDGPIYLDINPGYKFPDKQWIGEVTFYVYDGATPKPYTSSLNYRGNHKYEIKLSESGDFFAAAEEKSLSFISIKSNGSLNGKVYSHYNQKSPWQFRVELINRKLRYDKLYDLKELETFADVPKGWQKGRTAYKVVGEMEKENDNTRPKGLYIDRHSKFGETPDHRSYSKIFGAEYSFDWESGKKTGDSK